MALPISEHSCPVVLAQMRDYYFSATRALSPFVLDETLEDAIDRVLRAGRQHSRSFHINRHFLAVMDTAKAIDADEELQGHFSRYAAGHPGLVEAIKAVAVRTGAHHDIIYHTDPHRISGVPEILSRIEPYIRNEYVDGHVVLFIRDEDKIGLLASHIWFRQLLLIFDYRIGQKLSPFAGQNEFLSALYAGIQGSEEQIPPKYILAEILMIAGTIPWGNSGHFDELLSGRLREANELLTAEERLSDAEMQAFLLGAVKLANVDVGAFRGPLSSFHDGTWLLAKESSARFDTFEGMLEGLNKQYNFLIHVLLEGRLQTGSATVFHSYQTENGRYPQAVEAWEYEAKTIILQEAVLLQAMIAATGLLAAYGDAIVLDEAMPDPAQLPVNDQFRNTAILLQHEDQTPLPRVAAWLLEQHAGKTKLLSETLRNGGISAAAATRERYFELAGISADEKQALANALGLPRQWSLAGHL